MCVCESDYLCAGTSQNHVSRFNKFFAVCMLPLAVVRSYSDGLQYVFLEDVFAHNDPYGASSGPGAESDVYYCLCLDVADKRDRVSRSTGDEVYGAVDMSWSGDYQYADVPDDGDPTPVDAAEPAAGDVYVYPGARELAVFHDWYQRYHGYLASVVCVFGIVANALNIVVLTRRNMISATNCILTGLAVSDGLTMAAYLPFALRFYVLYGTESTPTRNSLPAVRFMLFFACFSVVVHTVSIWLTVVLAVFR